MSLASVDTDDLNEGSANLYFTNERVDDRVADFLTAGNGITLTEDDNANSLKIDSGMSVGVSPPSNAVVGNSWIDSETGRPYVYWNDGSSTQWVEIPSDNTSVNLNSHAIATILNNLGGIGKGLNCFTDATSGSSATFKMEPGSCSTVNGHVLTVGTTQTFTLSDSILDTGSITASTWYYAWLLRQTSSGSAVMRLSTSRTSPTLPSGHTVGRIVGAV